MCHFEEEDDDGGGGGNEYLERVITHGTKVNLAR